MDAAPNGNLWVADAGAGIVELSRGSGAGTLVASLPGVSDDVIAVLDVPPLSL